MNSPKIVFVGEAWGADEFGQKHPFVGKAGAELYNMLIDAGFPFPPIRKRFIAPSSMKKLWAESSVTLLNVFNCRPPDPEQRNRVAYFFGSRHEETDTSYLAYNGKYPLSKYASDIELLKENLRKLKPNVIVTLGNTAMWALLGLNKISAERGSVHESEFGKIIPTIHPAAILRKWDDRPLVVADLIKARNEQDYPEFSRVSRKLWIEPDLEDLETFWTQHLEKSSLISIDIETERYSQISEIGFAADPYNAIHVPILRSVKNGNKFLSCKRYWETIPREVKAWNFIHKVCTSPNPKIFQNGLYDIFWLFDKMGIPVRNSLHDTMLLHHARYIELQKSLGFLGATYLNEASWKKFRRESNKPDE